MMKLNEIRKLFLDFFARNDHTIIPSSPLVPQNDPTLMFTNAGMVQFKDYFIGHKIPDVKSVTSSQKCVRAGGKHNDLDNVGYTNRHHTFFEMLGNFSFGKYGKEQAISLAWEFITKELSLPADRLYVTVYHTDEEAAHLWQKITNFSQDKIIRISSNDNFWSMGDTGPCGPCSEIFYDNVGGIANGLPGSADEDSDRFVETWNLVFMQYDRHADGTQTLLPNIGIDTGMGLERITAVMQGVLDNYDIDLFQDLIKKSHALSNNSENTVAHKIITDHLRSSAFLIADGVMPSNQGRGYVLRRIIRRAVRYIYQLGHQQPLLCELFPTLLDGMGEDYPELSLAQDNIIHILKTEEESFLNTLGNGLAIMHNMIANLSAGNTLSGEDAFKLYDTYGFPLDITTDLLKEKNIKVDIEGFQQEMHQQKERAKAAWVGSGEQGVDKVWYEILDKYGQTEFLEHNNSLCEIAVMLRDNKIIDKAQYSSIKADDKIVIVLKQTPFYAEAGGQLGDTGILTVQKAGGLKAKVLDTKKVLNALYIHLCQVQSASLSTDDTMVMASFTEERKGQLKVAHSATHILHFILRQVLGKHVAQKGSLVAEERLRFDFSHNQALTHSQLQDIESKVNSMIWQNSKVSTANMPKEQAITKGVMALFGEKYADVVKVVTMADSVELCGGTHVHMTGEIGFFKIVKESSIGSAVRRIEALVKGKAYQYLSDRENTYVAEINNYKKKIKEDAKQYKRHESNLYKRIIQNIIVEIDHHEDVQVIVKIIKDIPINAARDAIIDYVQEKNIALFCVVNGQQACCLLAVSKDMIEKISALQLMKNIDEIKANPYGTQGLAQLNTESKFIESVIKEVKIKIHHK